MIYEIAALSVREDKTSEFRQVFGEVAPLLTRAQGYRGHVLAQGIETPELFNLIVRWRSLDDHIPRFEESEDHEQFMRGIQEYLSEEPRVSSSRGRRLCRKRTRHERTRQRRGRRLIGATSAMQATEHVPEKRKGGACQFLPVLDPPIRSMADESTQRSCPRERFSWVS
ncbi:antibiotic biosynthesis monooxygenase [Rhizobium sp. G21]|uniref:antibiotic biosynthesis monooxygenase family protein n=1 Tax=Rhizobium sp. G21 TaxID=2758439 RepID=UPI001AEEDF3F|nr:antibiotic biosynthesis monooxygenase [Rhizobium sp. G21]